MSVYPSHNPRLASRPSEASARCFTLGCESPSNGSSTDTAFGSSTSASTSASPTPVSYTHLFGAGKLPQIGDALGRSIKNFKKAADTGSELDVTPKKELGDSGKGTTEKVADKA